MPVPMMNIINVSPGSARHNSLDFQEIHDSAVSQNSFAKRCVAEPEVSMR